MKTKLLLATLFLSSLTYGQIPTTDLEQIANNAVDCNGQQFNAGQLV